MDALREAGNALLDFLYPPVCYLCRRVGAFVCEECIAAWPRPEPPVCADCGGPHAPDCRWCARGGRHLAGATFAHLYDGSVRDAVHLLKYKGRRRMAPAMANAMALVFQQAAGFRSCEVIVPVPLHFTRLRLRGYNQCDWLCDDLSGLLGLPVGPWLTRTRDTGAQVGRTARERLAHMQDAFIAAPAATGRHVLLVDDVTTTGATARDAARALRAAGAASVRLLTFARDA